MKKRIMTLDDLYNYYSQGTENVKFSCTEDDSNIVVQVNGKMNFNEDDKFDGLFPVNLQMCFVGDNLNGSRIETKSMEKALPSSKFRPILAYIHNVNGVNEFKGHEFHKDENGDVVYDEVPVGVISEEAILEYDEENDKEYACANGFIYEEYSKAVEILKRKKRCDVSVELSIRELSYSASDKILVLDDFYFSGCTILGVNDNGTVINPAMPGSNISFSNKGQYDDKMIDVLERLNTVLSNFNNNNVRKEEGAVENETIVMENENENVVVENENNNVVKDANVGENEDSLETTPESNEDGSIQCSVKIGDTTREFSVSMNDKLIALSKLVNDTYCDDMTYYDCVVYDETKEIVMVDYWNDKAYKQSYKVKDDVFSLKGDRIPVYSVWMTADEQKAFENMKANYSVIEAELNNYKSEPEKMNVLESSEYSYIANTEEFMELKKQENHFNMSVDEVIEKAKAILLDYAMKCKLDFSANENENVVTKKLFSSSPLKSMGRYEGIFNK